MRIHCLVNPALVLLGIMILRIFVVFVAPCPRAVSASKNKKTKRQHAYSIQHQHTICGKKSRSNIESIIFVNVILLLDKAGYSTFGWIWYLNKKCNIPPNKNFVGCLSINIKNSKFQIMSGFHNHNHDWNNRMYYFR